MRHLATFAAALIAAPVLYFAVVDAQGSQPPAPPSTPPAGSTAPQGTAQVLSGKWVTLGAIPMGSYCRDGNGPFIGAVTVGKVTLTPQGEDVKVDGAVRTRRAPQAAGAVVAAAKRPMPKPHSGPIGDVGPDRDELDDYVDGVDPAVKKKEEAAKKEAERKAAEAAPPKPVESLIPAADLAGGGVEVTVPGARGDGGDLVVRIAKGPQGLTIAAMNALEVRLEKTTLKIVDADFNGVPSSGDFFIYGERHLWMPWHSQTCSGRTIYQNIAGNDGVSVKCETRAMEEPPAGEGAVFDAWQEIRMDHGVPPGIYEAPLSADCIKHADYLKINNARGHDQDPSKPGYSPEGHAAGMDTYIRFSQNPKNGALAGFMTTAYHRVELINPTHTWLRMGGNDYAYCMSGTVHSKQWTANDRSWPQPQRYPAPFTSVPVGTYGHENPDHPGFERTKNLGLPVICRMPGHSSKVESVNCKLYEVAGNMRGGARGKEIECHLSYPNFQAPVGFSTQWNQVMLTPYAPLNGGAYEAEFKFTANGTPWHFIWRFEVGGAKPAAPRKGGK